MQKSRIQQTYDLHATTIEQQLIDICCQYDKRLSNSHVENEHMLHAEVGKFFSDNTVNINFISKCLT